MICSRNALDVMVTDAVRFAAAVSIWVPQHCLKPAEDISVIRGRLKRHGSLFVLNNIYRPVPTKEVRWADDGLDIRAMLAQEVRLR
jgi:hypothetical protein